MKKKLRVGTRGSKLARTQTGFIINKILKESPNLEIEEVVITTKGDRDARPFKDMVIGGEIGLFTKELEKALLGDEIDFAVHSLKDLPVKQPSGLVLGAIPKRGVPLDALVTRDNSSLQELASGSIVGTSSLRRASQFRHFYPTLRVQDMRGNLDTRLGKLADGEVDAVILAAAGLTRLGYTDKVDFKLIPPEICLPAPAQGALAIEIRENDSFLRDLLFDILDDYQTRQAVLAERELLQALGGGCQIPLGALASVSGDRLRLQGVVAAEDGQCIIKSEEICAIHDPTEAGRLVADNLTKKGAKEILNCE